MAITTGSLVRVEDKDHAFYGKEGTVIDVAHICGISVLTVESPFGPRSVASFAIREEKVTKLMTEEEACELEIC